VFDDGHGGAAGEFGCVAAGGAREFDEGEHGFGARLCGEEIGAEVPEVEERVGRGDGARGLDEFGELGRVEIEFGEDVLDRDGLVEEEGEDVGEVGRCGWRGVWGGRCLRDRVGWWGLRGHARKILRATRWSSGKLWSDRGFARAACQCDEMRAQEW